MIALLFTLFTYINEIMPVTVFDFNKNSVISNWYVVDDVVMGGRSYGRLSIDPKGNGVFKGNVSLENNGGFSSLRYRFKKQKIDQYQKMHIYPLILMKLMLMMIILFGDTIEQLTFILSEFRAALAVTNLPGRGSRQPHTEQL